MTYFHIYVLSSHHLFAFFSEPKNLSRDKAINKGQIFQTYYLPDIVHHYLFANFWHAGFPAIGGDINSISLD
jgi:hypothetical protein